MSQKIKFGMPYLLEINDVEKSILLAKELGLDFIELNSNFPSSLLKILEKINLHREGLFFTLHLDDSLNIADINPFMQKAALETSLAAVRLAKKWNIPTINIHFARGNVVTLPDGKRYIFQEYEEEFHKNLLIYRQRMEEAIGTSSLHISIENTDGWEDYERKAIDLLLESKVFALTLDIGHNHAVKDRDLDFFLERENKLIHMHAHDGWDQTNHQILGSGEIPLKERLDLARKTKANVLLEIKTLEALKTSIAWLKDHGYWK